MLRFCLSIVTTLVFATGALAQNLGSVDTLYRALGLPDVIEIMREEGVSYGDVMQKDLLQGRGGDRWDALVDDIYNLDQMVAIVRTRLDRELAGEDLAPMIAFFDSEIGRQIVQLEVSARRAFLETEIEDAAKDALALMIDNEDPRLDLIEDFAAAGDYIENNVLGALNSNFAFFVGLNASGDFPVEMSEEDIIADVWGQEPEIRDTTTQWLYAYLGLAYQPLSDDQLQTYIDFARTPEGRVLNQAIFSAFDEMFIVISEALGRAASQFLAGQEL